MNSARNATLIPALQNSLDVYETVCRPFCNQIHLPQTALDILLFLAGVPECCTVRGIVQHLGIQPDRVSRCVELLIQQGYLECSPLEGERRTVCLTCTEAAQPVIEQGRELQHEFFQLIFDGVSQEDLETVQSVFRRCGENVEKFRKNGRKCASE